MKCFKCTYDWVPRKENPKECPRCKTRLDYQAAIKPTETPVELTVDAV